VSRIASLFTRLAKQEETALIAYVMAGDPSLGETERIVLALEQSGADIVELGVPFSDPIADGPTIQQAADRALRSGTTLPAILTTVASLREKTQIPLLLMTYCNPVLAFGIEHFFQEAHAAGVDGVIIPDLPLEESRRFVSVRLRHRVDLILLVAPTTPETRMAEISQHSSGFIYYVSLLGITGTALLDRGGVKDRIRTLKKTTSLPVAAGFGISTPDEAAEIAEVADGIIIGSALVKIIATAPDDPAYLTRLSETVRTLKQAIGKKTPLSPPG
jgi:tryptophan synthase alpha chain